MSYELKPTDTPRAIIASLAQQLETVSSYLAEEHGLTRPVDNTCGCPWCAAIIGAKLEDERAQAWLEKGEAAPGITGRTLEVVLASLRYMQADMTFSMEIHGKIDTVTMADVEEILESGPTTPNEIDAICEEINQ